MQWCILFAIVLGLVVEPFSSNGAVGALAPKLIAVVLCQGLVIAVAWGLASRTIAAFQCQHVPRGQIIRQHESGKRCHLTFWVCINGLVLTVFGWPTIIESLGASGWSSGDALLRLGPMLVSLVISWAVYYDADRLFSENLSETCRRKHVLAQIRSYLLLPIIPILMVLANSDFLKLLGWNVPHGPISLTIHAAPLAVIVVAFPELLRLAWKTSTLPAGQLRSSLEREALRHDLTINDILVWNTGGQATNAAVCGIVPRWRYVLLSDRLVQEMPRREVKLVFGHEVAHAKLWHSVKLLMVMIVALATSLLIGRCMTARSGSFAELLAVVVPLGVTLLVVGRYARLFELEADLWASRECKERPEVYLSALANVAGHDDPKRASWLHPSFAERCRLVRSDPRDAVRWVRQQLWQTTCRFFMLAVAIAIMCAQLAPPS